MIVEPGYRGTTVTVTRSRPSTLTLHDGVVTETLDEQLRQSRGYVKTCGQRAGL